jgi:hypothetical protein
VVAIAIGVSIVWCSAAHSPVKIDLTPKEYLKAQLTVKNYKCAARLIGKESAWNPKAVNGSHYGYIQMRNTKYRDLDPMTMIDWSMKYTAHRYGVTKDGQPNWCNSYEHWKRYNWQ